MSEHLIILVFFFGLMVALGTLVYVLAKEFQRRGRMEVEREQQQATAQAQSRAGQELARHRTDDDTAGRLRDGTF